MIFNVLKKNSVELSTIKNETTQLVTEKIIVIFYCIAIINNKNLVIQSI